jgi:uncharacterized protein
VRKNVKLLTICSLFFIFAVALTVPLHLVAAGKPKTDALNCDWAVVTTDRHQGCDPATIRSLANEGRVYEQNQMGLASVLAIGSGYDSKQAVQWFEKAARQGYAPAQVNLAIMHANGWGVEQNYGRALYWLRLAADQKDARGEYNLGQLYFQGRGVNQDYKRASELFRQAADRGNSAAAVNLGYMYDRGYGVSEDHKAAADWYRKAADTGNAMGESNLGDMYLRGDGVPQDDAIALRLFQKAAAQGHTGARIKLGYMYAQGRATAVDLQAAYTWIMAASMAGDQRGRDLAAQLEQRLNATQKAQASKQAHELQTQLGNRTEMALLP